MTSVYRYEDLPSWRCRLPYSWLCCRGLFFVIRANCTDQGAPGSVPLTGERTITLRPEQWQAEHAVKLSGPQVVTASSATGGERLGDIQNGEWAQLFPASLSGVTGLKARVSSGGQGGDVSFRLDSPTGPEIAEVHPQPAVRQVPGHQPERYRRRHEGAVVDLQRQRRPEGTLPWPTATRSRVRAGTDGPVTAAPAVPSHRCDKGAGARLWKHRIGLTHTGGPAGSR